MVDTAIVVRESAPIVVVPRTLQEMIDIAERLAKSSLLPDELRGKVPEVLMQIMAGQELGLYSMASLRSFHIIKGKPVMGADAMVAVVLGSGKAEYFRRVGEGSDKSVTYATKRRGGEEQRCTWTIEMAKTASLHQKDNWRTFTRQMLASRAKSELARDVYPDVLAGCYSVDEVNDRAPSAPPPVTGETIEDAEFVDAPVDYPELAEISKAETIEECKAIAGRFAKHGMKPGNPAYDAMTVAYKAQVQTIKARPAADGATTQTESTESATAPEAG